MRVLDIGIVPAGGKARRLRGSVVAKELLTIGEVVGPGSRPRPKAVSEYLFEALLAAHVQRVWFVISPDKHDLLRFYGSGDRYGVQIAYTCQEVPSGMADAIDRVYPWIGDATVLLGMPDTIFRPIDALAKLRMFFEREDADLALGVFPTEEAGRLGPVVFDAGGQVSKVLDKPAVCSVSNTWGIACWGVAFTEFLHAAMAAWPRSHGERALGSIFQSSVERGLRVRALSFDDGVYFDVGTMEGLSTARRAVERWSTDPGIPHRHIRFST